MNQPLLMWDVAVKDLRLFLADRRGAVLCLVVPIVLASAFGAIFQRPGDDGAVHVAAVVVAPAESATAQRIVRALVETDRVRVTILDEANARAQLAARLADVVLILPGDLERMTLLPARRDRVPSVEVLHAPGHALEARLVEGLFTEAAMRETARALLGPASSDAAWLPPFDVRRAATPDAGKQALNSYAHSFCGMTLQYLLFWGMDSGLLILRERRLGIWRRLRIAPVGSFALLGGRALATTIVALLQILGTFAFGWLVFGVTIGGSVAGFVLLAAAAAVLAAATGLLVAALGGTEERARPVAILVILTLSMLGGLWLPSFLLPEWMRRIALALPTTWAARGLEGVTWQGMAWPAAARCAVVVFVFSAVFLTIAWIKFGRSEMSKGATT